MKVWAVGLFGMAGALLRYMVGIWVSNGESSLFPLGTWVVNLAGCLLLGWFIAWTGSRPGLPAWLRVGISTGLLGSFTTFSTFSVETVHLVQDGYAGMAGLYVILSILGGFSCAWGGMALHQLQRRRKPGGDQV